MVGHLKPFSDTAEIERRAQSYKDPVERLRYLRHATTARKRSKSWIAGFALAMAILTLRSDAINRETPVARPHRDVTLAQATDTPNVWPVEQTDEYDLYSNGLRIENRLAVSNEPRLYRLIDRATGTPGPPRDRPAGIVFHTTESDQAPFEPAQKHALKRLGESLLLYVRNKRAYHFVIDRFGRVHRIVVESDTANHAGHSIWADSNWAYVGLNASFLGVAFEAQTQPDQPSITEAQLRAGKALTEMLRAKYNLPAENCVAHAQVSVNPSNMRIGWHTDWGVSFPFRQMGLPDNYEAANPSLYLYGFEYDPAYINSTGQDLQKGLARAEEQLQQAATDHHATLIEYRRVLQQRFRDALSALQQSAGEENQHESN
jgi:N-acetyl-anhydromuramyl-L-alanine amidase AmpD